MYDDDNSDLVRSKGEMNLDFIILLLLIMPLGSAAILAMFYQANLRIFRRITIILMALPLFPLLYLVYDGVQLGSLASHTLQVKSGSNILSFNYGVDSVSLWLSVITSLVMLSAVIFGIYIKKRQKQFYMLAILIQGVTIHIYLSRDALLLCASLLFLMLFIMFLLGSWSEKDATITARRFAYRMLSGILSITMSCIILLGLSTQAVQPEAALLVDHAAAPLELYLESNILIEDSNGERYFAFALLLLGLMLILPMFGLHRPFLNIFRNSPIMISVIYSTIVGTSALYIGYRLGLGYFADLMLNVRELVMWGLALQWLFTCISLWRQKDAKSWLAYSVWGQYSVLLLLLFVQSEIGLMMLWLHTLSFQLLVGLMGGLIAAINERTKSMEFSDWSRGLNGLPFLSGLFVVTMLAWLGLPGLSHFLGTYHALLLSFPISRWITVCLVLGVLSSTAVALRIIFNMQHGQPGARLTNIQELRFIEAFPASVLLTIMIVVGVYPIIIMDLLEYDIHQVVVFWQQVEVNTLAQSVGIYDLLRMGSEAWQWPVMLATVMSLVIWLVNHRQEQWTRMLFWQAIYYALTLVVVLSSAYALQTSLDMNRIVIIMIWYGVMFIGSYCMMKLALMHSGESLLGIRGLYYRNRVHAFILLLFHLVLMSAPLTAGFTFQLSVIELWSSEQQYGLIMLWLTAHTLMATIPLENIIQMYMNSEESSISEQRFGGALQSHGQKFSKGYMWVTVSCLFILLALAIWI